MSKRIDRVDIRTKLNPRREPHWLRITQGRYVGFRRITPSLPGTWLARIYDPQKPLPQQSRKGKDRKEPGGYNYKSLGDFAQLPEKERFDAAKLAAEDWFRHLDRGGSTISSTVKGACEAYVDDLKNSSEAASKDAKGRFARLVYSDSIANIELTKLAPRNIAEWKNRVLANGGTKGSFNRNATAFRAALNLAYQRSDVASDHAWRNELKPFKDADGQRDLYLKRPERARLLDKATAEAQRFIKTLLLLPLRPGDVAKLQVEHFDAHQKTVAIPSGKTKTRVIPLSSDAVAHFKECAKSKLPAAPLVSRDAGAQWKKEDWNDAIKDASASAKLPAATCAYTLRHCSITDLVTGGLDLFTVAKISGTSVRMIELHYGHLQQKHARAALNKLAQA